MWKLNDISPDTVAFPWKARTTWTGTVPVLAVGGLLAAGAASGHEAAGAIAAGAAYTVGFGVFHEALVSALLSMGLLTVGIATATLAGSLGAGWTVAVLALTLLAAFNYGLLAGISNTAGWIGQQCAVFLVINCYFAQGLHYAVGRAGMVLLGGAAQMLVFTVRHGIRHSGSERTAPPLPVRLRSRLRQLWEGLQTELPWHGLTLQAEHEQTLNNDEQSDAAKRVEQRRHTNSYIVRLAITLLLCTALYRFRHIRNGYWAPMTGLLVLKPQWSSTLSRGIARLTGTLAGAGVAVLLARYVDLSMPVIFAGVLVWAWATYALQAVNYAAFSLCLTLYTVFLFRFGGFSQTSAAHIRLYNTALGGGIALLVDLTWKLLVPRLMHARPGRALRVTAAA